MLLMTLPICLAPLGNFQNSSAYYLNNIDQYTCSCEVDRATSNNNIEAYRGFWLTFLLHLPPLLKDKKFGQINQIKKSKQCRHWHILKFLRNIRNFCKVVYKVAAPKYVQWQNKNGDMKSGQKLEAATRGLHFIQKTPTQVLSCEYCKSFKNTYFEKHLQTIVSENWKYKLL